MHKKNWITGTLLLAAFSLHAQVSMTLQVPPVGVLVKNQLWNMLVVNAGNTSLLIRVNLVLLDEKTNQPVLSASSAPVVLPKGARQLQARDLGPVQYAYSDPAFHTDGDPNGMLPAGGFQACYTIINSNKNQPLVENCIRVNVAPLSPPLLNTPADEALLSVPYLQFTWLPPTPPGIFNDLTYAFTLVEVLPGQGKADAIQQNIPVYSPGFVKNLYINYPSSFHQLDTAKTYAWRITALNARQPVAASDIWTFRISTPRPSKPLPEQEPWVALKRGLEPAVASAKDIIKISYDNAAADSLVQYTITGIDAPGNPVVQQDSIPLRYGPNLLQLPLQRNAGYEAGKTYLFRLVNSRNETWSVKFTIK
jgi:hypothetical protein